MHVWWSVLECGVVLGDEGFDIFVGLIVQFVELGTVASYLKEVIDFGVGFDDFAAVLRFDGIRFYEICVDGVEYHDVVVSAVRCDGEAASLIGEELPVNFDHGHEYYVCLVIVGCLWMLDHVIRL